MKHVVQFDIKYVQYLNEDAALVADLPTHINHPDIMRQLYEVMVLANAFDKKAIALQRTGKMGTYAPINGQEAIATAIGHALAKEDIFIPYYRDYAAQIQRGVKMEEIFAYWGGDERGSDFKENAQDYPICVPIASQCLHAAGVGFAIKYKHEKKVALVCIGDGGTSEGDFYEALNVAGAWQLPVVFVINNNQWAISVPISKQTKTETLAQKAISAGFEGVQVDGNDVLALRDVIGCAIEKARSGGGPTLIEAISYRLSDHTTADDATRYQPKEEVDNAKPKTPIQRLKTYMENKGIWDATLENICLKSAQEKVQTAQDNYLNTTPQPISAIFDYHYATLPDYLIEQRAIAVEEFEYD